MPNLAKSVARGSSCLMLVSLGLFGQPAIAQIAPGVTQSAAHTANITGTVTQTDGTPITGAVVRISGPALLSTKTDAHGFFGFRSVPWGTYQIVVTSLLGSASRNNVALYGDIVVAIQYQTQSSLRMIAHVSTTGAGAHINVTSSSIDSVSPSEYAFQGNGSWAQLFAQIPGVAASGYLSGGQSPLGAIPGAPQAPVVLSLNGSLPYETSTTLDGMPLQGVSADLGVSGAGFDLGSLPLNAFDTADVVRGPGANAPSIIDSVGGSFVLHAPAQVAANHFEFSISNDPYGGIISNAKVALHLGRLSATFIYGVNDSPGPLGTGSLIPALSTVPSAIGGQTAWGPYASLNPNAHRIANCYCTVTDSFLICCTPQSTAWTVHSGAAALFYQIAPSVNAEVFYSGQVSRQFDQGGYYPVEFAPNVAVPAYSGSLSPSPAGATSYAFLYLPGTPPLSNEASSLLEEKVTAYFGNGVLRLAALQNNTFTYEQEYLSPANGEYTVWGTLDVGAFPGTPTAYNGTRENLSFPNESLDLQTWANNRDLLGSYAVQVGSASSIGVSFNTSYYNNPYSCNFFFGKILAFSSAFSPATSETTNETRLHVDTEISNKLSVGLSWYFAEGAYHVPAASNPNAWINSIFSYNAPRIGAAWEASPDLSVRASVGGGYALPILGNLVGTPLSFTNGAYFQSIPNPSAKPEESFGFDVGTDVRLQHDTVLSLDLYRTNLSGQFYRSITVSTFNGAPFYLCEFGNIGTSLMEGIKLDVRHDVSSGYYWRGTLGFTRGYVTSVPSGFYNNPSVPCTNCANQGIIPGLNFNSAAFQVTVPYASASAQLGYRWTPGKYFDFVSTYYGNNNIYNTPHAFVELDAHAAYAVTRNVSLLVTFRNITNAYGQDIITYNPSYAMPVISGATGYYSPGAVFAIPYGPRTVIVTADFHY